jgi:death-on-curing protein
MAVWLKRVLAVALHDRQLAEHGGSTGIRDETLLDSALARPQQLYAYGDPRPDLADLAATLAFGLAKNHPFVDGNKRTAAVACETFIELNGGQLNATDAEFFPAILGLADGTLTLAEFTAWLREQIPAQLLRVQERRARYRKRLRKQKRPRTPAQRKKRRRK